jgi:hypothetical protein
MEKFSGEPPTVWHGHLSIWQLRSAKTLAARVEALGYKVSCSKRDVTVELGTASDEQVAQFLAAMRDLGCVFYDSPKGVAPVAAVRRLRRTGLLKGDFSELIHTPTGGWRIRPI